MFTMKMTCTEIKADKVDDKVFEVPSDYKPMTKEEFMKMSGGGPLNLKVEIIQYTLIF